MKAIITFTVVFFVAGVFGGSIYNETDEAVKEVESKYNEAITYSGKVAQEIEAEKGKAEQGAADDAKKEGKDKHDATVKKFDKDIVDATRSAIARGKPVQAIECIARVSVEGKKLIAGILDEHSKAVDSVKTNREAELELAKLQTELIKAGTEGLMQESVKKIKNEKTPNGLKALKADALKKAATATKQLLDIETRILKPVLKERYLELRKVVAIRYKEIQDSLLKRLQKCIA